MIGKTSMILKTPKEIILEKDSLTSEWSFDAIYVMREIFLASSQFEKIFRWPQIDHPVHIWNC